MAGNLIRPIPTARKEVGMNMTDAKAITATVVAVATAIIAVIVTYAPNWMTQPQKDSIITLITVVTPVVLGLIGLLHHNTAKVMSASALATGTAVPTSTRHPGHTPQ
jgi:hypothetical protein